MLKNNSILSAILVLLPITVVLAFDSMAYLWVGMEVQTLVFLLFLWNTGKVKKSIIAFLIIQMFSSSLLFCFITLGALFGSNSLCGLVYMASLLLKMGMVPFHAWALNFIKSLEFFSFFVFITFMKLIPFFMLKLLNCPVSDLVFIFNMVLSVAAIFNVNSFKEIIFFSSLFLGGLLLILSLGEGIFDLLLFFCVYSLAVCLMIQDSILNFSGFVFGSSKEIASFSTMLSVLALLGMPFSLGFLAKVVFLQAMSLSLANILFSVLLVLGSVVLSYHYMKILHFYYTSLSTVSYSALKMKKEGSLFSALFHILGPFFFSLSILMGGISVFYLN